MFLLALSIWIVAVNCQSLPRLEHLGYPLPNNSYVCYSDVRGDSALKCVTDNVNCCHDSNNGNWTDSAGRSIEEGLYTDLNVTRGDGVINLNYTGDYHSTLERCITCNIPDAGGEMQSLKIIIKSSSCKLQHCTKHITRCMSYIAG